jgi:hypothetical protein
MIDVLAGLVGSGTDVATLVVVAWAYLREVPAVRATRAWVAALAREVDGVPSDRARAELEVDEVDVEARTARAKGGRRSD